MKVILHAVFATILAICCSDACAGLDPKCTLWTHADAHAIPPEVAEHMRSHSGEAIQDCGWSNVNIYRVISPVRHKENQLCSFTRRVHTVFDDGVYPESEPLRKDQALADYANTILEEYATLAATCPAWDSPAYVLAEDMDSDEIVSLMQYWRTIATSPETFKSAIDDCACGAAEDIAYAQILEGYSEHLVSIVAIKEETGFFDQLFHGAKHHYAITVENGTGQYRAGPYVVFTVLRDETRYRMGMISWQGWQTERH